MLVNFSWVMVTLVALPTEAKSMVTRVSGVGPPSQCQVKESLRGVDVAVGADDGVDVAAGVMISMR